MKKLLCLLLCVVMMFSLAACGDSNPKTGTEENTKPEETEAAEILPDETEAPETPVAYDDVIACYVRYFIERTVTDEEVRSMLPEEIWNAEDFSAFYEWEVCENLANSRFTTEDNFGLDAAASYEIVGHADASDSAAFKERQKALKEAYGVDADKCYDVEITGTLSGEKDAAEIDRTVRIIQISGVWYLDEFVSLIMM